MRFVVFAHFFVLVLALQKYTKDASDDGSASYLVGFRSIKVASISIRFDATSCRASTQNEFDDRVLFCFEKEGRTEFRCERKKAHDLCFSQSPTSSFDVFFRARAAPIEVQVDRNGTVSFQFTVDLNNGKLSHGRTELTSGKPKLAKFTHWDGTDFFALRFALVRRGAGCDASISFLDNDAHDPTRLIDDLEKGASAIPRLVPTAEPKTGFPGWFIFLIAGICFVIVGIGVGVVVFFFVRHRKGKMARTPTQTPPTTPTATSPATPPTTPPQASPATQTSPTTQTQTPPRTPTQASPATPRTLMDVPIPVRPNTKTLSNRVRTFFKSRMSAPSTFSKLTLSTGETTEGK
ncbi:hypothetical protein QR680_012545 [Steinernema hermaphroditum]|uniref:Uncharacterized protein n=1 Tax=Steinernema hermaphroditum TaxID=289476 RepID=A0AA39I3X7_9BILA|nr:hypothetical protein QR680_012545 [Steinernema hermaphroditum]